MERAFSKYLRELREDSSAFVGVIHQVILYSFFFVLSSFLFAPALVLMLSIFPAMIITLWLMGKFRRNGYEWTLKNPRFLEGFVFTLLVFSVCGFVGAFKLLTS